MKLITLNYSLGPQSTGLGGGFHLTIFIKEKNLVECLDAREVAPKNAHENMFVNDKNKSSLEGGLSIAVPGELKGKKELNNLNEINSNLLNI